MSTVADVSLAVIALVAVLVVIVAIPVLIQVGRAAKQAELALGRINGALPSLLMEIRTILGSVAESVRHSSETLRGFSDTLHNLSASIERLDRFMNSTARTVEGVQTSARQMAEQIIMPSVATAAGVLSVLRESMQWIRPRREKGRDNS